MSQNPPMNSQSVKQAFETIAPDWDRLREKPWAVVMNFLEKYNYVHLFDDGYLLDLGCGNGRHSLLFSNRAGHVLGIDFSLNLLRIAKKKRNQLCIDNISYIIADISFLPIKNEIINNSIFLATLHHIPCSANRQSTLLEIRRVLKPLGNCLVTTWRRWQKRFFWHFLKEIFHNLVKFRSFSEFGDIFIPWIKQTGEPIQRFYHLFTQREMKKLSKQAGFQIVLIKNYGGATQKENIFTLLKK
ncbi:MAG: methyltransferase domain-containing protein [Candidatus Helarchaeota archaeon]|nr:methyltransferase domain-containing protein [Candidatus Helarchaeota archaeon]